MTREEIEQLANERYPTAKDDDASLTTISEREGWIAGFEAGMQSVIDNIPDLEWYSGRAQTAIGIFKITHCLNFYSFDLGEMRFWKNYDRAEDAMQAANEYYKERIKRELGL